VSVQKAAKTVLLTLGRLPVALDMARSFHASGWRVLIADPWPMHLARTSRAVARCFRVTSPVRNRERYLDELRTIVADNEVRLVVPVSEESPYVAALADPGGLDIDIFCMPQGHMLELHDKFRFIKLAERFGLRVPATWLGSDAGGKTAGRHYDVVVKPRHSCSGRGVSYHAAGSSFDADERSVVQQRLRGQHYSSFSVAREGKVLATATYRAIVIDGSVAVCFERVADQASVDAWCSEFVKQSGHTGFISFDFIADDDGNAAAIECNPRATSGIHFLRTEALASLILGESPAAPLHRAEQRLTESYSCFTAVLASLFSPQEFRSRFAALRSARDVTWDRSDPWPYLLMMVSSWRILALTLFSRHSFAAAAILDIEWQETAQD
jgi:predicted ATP-grasp superfamily ATP-dependent carboligase